MVVERPEGDKRTRDKENMTQFQKNNMGHMLGSNPKPVEREDKQRGNQKSSQSVWLEEI